MSAPRASDRAGETVSPEGYVAAAAVAIILCLGLALPRSLAFAVPMGGVICAVLFFLFRRSFPVPSRFSLALVLGISAWATASALWALDPAFALERAGKIALILAPGLLLLGAARTVKPFHIRPCFVRIVAALYALCALFFFFQYATDFSTVRMFAESLDERAMDYRAMFNRSMVILVLLYLPILLATLKTFTSSRVRTAIFVSLTLCVLAALILTKSQSAQLAFLTGGLFYLFFPVRIKAAWVALASMIALGILAAPFVAGPAFNAIVHGSTVQLQILLEAGVPHRLEIWSFMASHILDRPFFGHGIEAARFLVSDRPLTYPGGTSALHPHSAVFQIWLEFGFAGIVAALAALAGLLYRVQNWPQPQARLSLAVMMAFLVMAANSYGLWQSWFLGLFLLMASVLVVAGSALQSEESPK